MAETMVERVARALAADIDAGLPQFTAQRWEELTALARATMLRRARVLIEVMREPTPEMVKAGHDRDPLGCDVEYANDVYPVIWQAMIDEAVGNGRVRG